jgi:hypothetical protein
VSRSSVTEGLLGPKRGDLYAKWRANRDRRIAQPRRNKAAQKLAQPKAPA